MHRNFCIFSNRPYPQKVAFFASGTVENYLYGLKHNLFEIRTCLGKCSIGITILFEWRCDSVCVCPNSIALKNAVEWMQTHFPKNRNKRKPYTGKCRLPSTKTKHYFRVAFSHRHAFEFQHFPLKERAAF